MNNKQIIKEMFDKEFNKELNEEKMRNQILLEIKKKERRKLQMNKYFKWSFAPIGLIAVICGIFVFGNNNNSVLAPNKENDKPYIDKSNSVILNINNISGDIKTNKIDAEIKEVSNYYNIPYYEVLSNLAIPSDFDNKEYINAVFTKSDREKLKYDYFMQYEKTYKNKENNRMIVISYSEDNEPLRDYHFGDGKTSKINDFDLIIYKYETSYMTAFNYKDLNIDIETTNITEEELVSLLQSIIK